MSKTYFTSDTHFNHANIIAYCKRPWVSVDDMNMALIDRWNATVGPDDTVYHLGDFALGKQEDAVPIFDLLHGGKHLIAGNHDGSKVRNMAWLSRGPFLLCKEFMLIHDPGNVPRIKEGRHTSLVLHGHLHGTSDLHPFKKMPNVRRYVDVGVDCWDYRPVSMDQIMELMA